MPDYNHDGKIDKTDKEMEEIFLEEDERIQSDYANNANNKSDAWVVLIVLGIMGFIFLMFCRTFGIH